MPSNLEADLIDGGLTPAAAKAIANAIGNQNSNQQRKATQLVDGTPTEMLRMVTPEARRSYFSNLDQPKDARFARRLAAQKRAFGSNESPHSYDHSEPRATTSRINTPSIVAGDLLKTSTAVEQDVQQTKISVDYTGDGRHLRLNAQKDAIEAVDLATENQTEARIANEFVNESGRTVLKSKIQGLGSRTVALADGTGLPVSGWFDGAQTPSSIWTSWAASNLFNSADLSGFWGSVADIQSWTPYLRTVSSGVEYTLSDATYQHPNGKDTRAGLYIKLGDLVVFWFRLRPFSTTNGVTNTASAAFANSAGGLVIGGLPFSPQFSTEEPFFGFEYPVQITSTFSMPAEATYASGSLQTHYFLNEAHLEGPVQGVSQGIALRDRRLTSLTTSPIVSYASAPVTRILTAGTSNIDDCGILGWGAFLTTDLSQIS